MQRKKYSAEFKAKIALEAVKGLKTINEIAGETGVHPTQIQQWKKQLLEELPNIYSQKKDRRKKQDEEQKAQLYKQIGQLKVELDWVKKKAGIFSS